MMRVLFGVMRDLWQQQLKVEEGGPRGLVLVTGAGVAVPFAVGEE